MNSNLPPGVIPSDVDGSNECPECDGTGDVNNPEHDRNDPESSETKACAACEGTGLKTQ